ncbi:MAG: peptidyl-prolyl cis-trans isomerase [Elusimicrobiales bacterium]
MKKLVICVAAMVCAGIAFAAQKGSDRAAEVNGEAIKKSDVDARLWSLFGVNLTNDLINERLILQEAAKQKITVDAASVDKNLQNLKGQGKQAEDFTANLKAQGISEDVVRNQIRIKTLAEALAVKKFDIKTTDADAEAFFKLNKKSLDKPEGVSAVQLSVPSSQEAQDMLSAVKAGADFKNLAVAKCTANKLCPADGSPVVIYKGQLPADVEKAVFALQPGETSQVINGNNVFIVVKMIKAVPAAPAEFAALKDQISSVLQQQKVGQAVPEMIKQLRAEAKIKVY